MQRDALMLRILKNIQKRLSRLEGRVGGVEGRMGKMERQMAEGFKAVIKRIDQHRAFAIDRLRDHERRLISGGL